MELTLGALAGALCQGVVLPIGIVTTRQQTTRDNKSMLATAKSIIKEDGVQDLWKGLRAALVLCINPAITFGVFERLKSWWMEKRSLKYLTSGIVSTLLSSLKWY